MKGINMTKLLTSTAVLLALVAPATAFDRPIVPVVVGQDGPDYDACASSGTVEGLNPRGDGFLAVKSGPGLNFERIDKLYNGQHVYICGYHGDWYAIVYSGSARDPIGCNVMTSWHKTMPYTGPCRSGWVHKRWIGNLAG
jgi:hypothetical protein